MPSSQPSFSAPITVVSVTYGYRQHFLCKMIEGCQAQGVTHFVIVNNGAHWDVHSLVASYPDIDVHIVDMGGNKGSAAGFAAGIQGALDQGAELVWLMDDDNCPREGSLSTLLDAYTNAAECTDRQKLAVLAFRPEHQADVAMGVSEGRINARPNSFRGFHVLDIPFKIWRRTPWGKPRVKDSLPSGVSVHQAPYSGLLFHRDVIQAIGLPNEDFVLYADDNEFTWRIHERGGRIILVTDALLDDLESSWNIKDRFGNSFAGMLKGEGDFRAYYGMRNGVYFDTKRCMKSAVMLWVNRTVYMSILFAFSRLYKEPERYRLLREAVRDGAAGKLGLDNRFPL